jgi:hypothetical protein
MSHNKKKRRPLLSSCKKLSCNQFTIFFSSNMPRHLASRVSTEVTFWHSAEYGSDFRLNSGEIPRNSAEFRGISPEFSRNHFRSQKIPRNYVLAEFRGHPTCECFQPAGRHRDQGYAMSSKVVFKFSPFKLAFKPDKKEKKYGSVVSHCNTKRKTLLNFFQ